MKDSTAAPPRARRRHPDKTESAEQAGSKLTPLFVSVDEAGALLGISRAKAWRLVYTGRLRSVRLDRRVLVPVKDLEAFAAELVATAEVAAAAS